MDRSEFEGVLGAGTKTTGELSFEGRVRIAGEFRGEIRSESTLEIGPDARVEAEIDVGELVVHGEFRGTVTARRRVLIRSTGRVTADLETGSLAMETGAIFNGSCEMEGSGDEEAATGAMGPTAGGGRAGGNSPGTDPSAGPDPGAQKST